MLFTRSAFIQDRKENEGDGWDGELLGLYEAEKIVGKTAISLNHFSTESPNKGENVTCKVLEKAWGKGEKVWEYEESEYSFSLYKRENEKIPRFVLRSATPGMYNYLSILF